MLFLTRLSRPPIGSSRSEGSAAGGTGLDERGVMRYSGTSADDLRDGAGVVAGVVKNVRVDAKVEAVATEVAEVGISQSRSEYRVNPHNTGAKKISYHRRYSYLRGEVAKSLAGSS